jgi:hypothetical protein
MSLTPFHLCPIWQNYHVLRPRAEEAYRSALEHAVKRCQNSGKSTPRILVLGAGDGKFDLDLIQDILSKNVTSVATITVVDWYIQPLKGAGYTYESEDIERFLADDRNAGKYDIVVAFLVLQHLVNWRSAVTNIATVAPGGQILFDEYRRGKAGWLDWIDGTAGFVGLDARESPAKQSGKWAAFFRDYYLDLDRKQGLFWEPEIRGTDCRRLHTALTYAGFSLSNQTEGKTQKPLSLLAEHFRSFKTAGTPVDPAGLFSHFSWGSEAGPSPSHSNLMEFINAIPSTKEYAFIKQLLVSPEAIHCRQDVGEVLEFESVISAYDIPTADHFAAVAKRIAETYWFDGFHDSLFHRILLRHIEEITDHSATDDYEQLQRRKLVQYLIVSGGLTHDLAFAAPVLMTITNLEKWETQTSKDSILLVNNASMQIGAISGHLQRMVAFASEKTKGSITESLLALRLPISVSLAMQDASQQKEQGSEAQICVTPMHTGKLAEVSFSRKQLEAFRWSSDDETEKNLHHLASKRRWRFSRFRAIIFTPDDLTDGVTATRTTESLSFKWGQVGDFVATDARGRIERWIRDAAPFLAPLLLENLRVTIIGLYHVRIGNDGYGGLGSLFLVENSEDPLTDFDRERFRFVQSESQKFSTIYMIETVREFSRAAVDASRAAAEATKIKREMDRIAQPLRDLRALREEMEKASSAIAEIESALNPYYLNVATVSLSKFHQDLSGLFGHELNGKNYHDVCEWDSSQMLKLKACWKRHQPSVLRDLEQSNSETYQMFFGPLDDVSEKSAYSGAFDRKSVYLAKALHEGVSPVFWVYASLSKDPAFENDRYVSLNNSVPPFAFNLALIALGKSCTFTFTPTELVLSIEITENKAKGKLEDLANLVVQNLNDYKNILMTRQQTTAALTVLIRAANQCQEISERRVNLLTEGYLRVDLTYPVGQHQ